MAFLQERMAESRSMFRDRIPMSCMHKSRLVKRALRRVAHSLPLPRRHRVPLLLNAELKQLQVVAVAVAEVAVAVEVATTGAITVGQVEDSREVAVEAVVVARRSHRQPKRLPRSMREVAESSVRITKAERGRR